MPFQLRTTNRVFFQCLVINTEQKIVYAFCLFEKDDIDSDFLKMIQK